VNKMKHPSRTDTEEIETYKIKDPSFLALLEKIVKGVEQYFSENGVNQMSQVVDER